MCLTPGAEWFKWPSAQRQAERDHSSDVNIDYYGGIEVLPLKEIVIKSAPFHKAALKWSCDADLAVAGDDSVRVFPPIFPGGDFETLTRDRKEREDRFGTAVSDASDDDTSGDDGNPDNETANDSWGDDEESYRESSVEVGTGKGRIDNEENDARYQFTSGSRHIAVARPPMDPRVNRRLYEAAGLVFPYDCLVFSPSESSDSEGFHDDKQQLDNEKSIFTTPTGAGAGLLTSQGSTMNSVVALDWSPSGAGRNRRPVLAVLTTSGILTVYGEGPPGRHGRKKRAGYHLMGWQILWAVGERFVVPPQTEYGECVIAFAWARELGPDQAILAYQTEQKEIVIVSSKRQVVPASGVGDGLGVGEATVWHVKEIARFAAASPHFQLSQDDPDYMPRGSSFGLAWSPWLTEGSVKKTAILSYIDNNYVGFRRITIEGDWRDTTCPTLSVDKQDSEHSCVFLSTDAFVEWEDAVSRATQGDTTEPG